MRRGRGLRCCGCGSSAVVAKAGVAALRTKLSRRDGAADLVVGDGGDVEVAGVVAPEGSADSPKLVAGVDGGGSGPGGDSVKVDHGRWRSLLFPRW